MSPEEREALEYLWQWGACDTERIAQALRRYCPQVVAQPAYPRVWYGDEPAPPPLETHDASGIELVAWARGQLAYLEAKGMVERKRLDSRWHLTEAARNMIAYGTTWKWS